VGSSPIGPAIREQGISVERLKSLFSLWVPLWVYVIPATSFSTWKEKPSGDGWLLSYHRDVLGSHKYKYV